MKILSENSILNTLPAEIPKNEFLIFDAVRFSFEILENNFRILEIRLLDISLNNKKEVSITSHYAWSIIDYTDRIRELLYQLPWEKPDEILGNFKHLKDFRNTFQHLGKRKDTIIKKLSTNNLVERYKTVSRLCKLYQSWALEKKSQQAEDITKQESFETYPYLPLKL